jgi:hypothetical protein
MLGPRNMQATEKAHKCRRGNHLRIVPYSCAVPMYGRAVPPYGMAVARIRRCRPGAAAQPRSRSSAVRVTW